MKQLFKILLILSLVSSSLFSEEVKYGSLSVLVFSNGKPLAANEIKVDGKKILRTDSDGSIQIRLMPGNHQVEIFGKDAVGVNLGYFKKHIRVETGKDTQVIATLSKTGSDSMAIDVPLKSSERKDVKVEASTGTGILLGRVLSSEGNQPISGARVFVRGTAVDTRTDANGNFKATVPSGKSLSISVVHSAYSAQTVDGISVKADGTTSKTVKLTPASMELEEYVVLSPKVEGSITDAVEEVKSNDTVGDVLGSEQFSKSGDSSVASALKRVSGITIVGGKYVYVRGLGDRYSTVMFNDLDIPSPEPTKRVVPLDIFPTSVIQSMTIQKSYSGDLPASFGGGTVLIKSKDIPKNGGFAEADIELMSNSSTGSSVNYNPDTAVPLPANVISQSNDFEYINNSTLTNEVLQSRSLNTKKKVLLPGGKVSFSLGDSYDVTDNVKVGASANFFYKNTSDSTEINYDKYVYDINSESTLKDSTTKSDVTTLQTQFGGMFNLGANYFGNNRIKYTYFGVTDTNDNSISSTYDYVGDEEDRDKNYFEHIEKTVSMHQLIGSNELLFGKSTDTYFDNLIIDWAVEHATATRDEPGTVETNYLHQTSGINWNQKNWYYYFMLNDTVDNYRADFTLPYRYNENDNYTKMGVFVYTKSRDFDSRRFKLSDKSASGTGIDLSQDMDTIYSNYNLGDLQFESAYQNTDSYAATQDITAVYLKQLYSLTQDIDLIASVRYEDSFQQLTDVATGDPYTPLNTADLFPALGLTYRFADDDMQLRLAYARTISRPDFREFSPNRYKDPITENIVFGNPDLKATYINHLDLKYEWYFSSDEFFSMALFAKNFENPIESVVRKNDAQGNEFEQSYANASSADSYGVELDLRKRFDFINEDWGNDYLFATNFAWIESKIQVDEDAYPYFTARLTTHDRAMQGQSPYVLNFQIGYDDAETGNSAMLLYNSIGERIVSLGTDHNEDTYEQPFNKVDFTTKWNLNKPKDGNLAYSLLFKAENLLDDTVTFTQGSKETQTFKPGRFFSLKCNVKY